MKHEIQFVEELPPARATSAPPWRHEVVEHLKQRPGQWAIVERETYAASATSWRRLGVEAVSRKLPEYATNRADIYARWPADD